MKSKDLNIDNWRTNSVLSLLIGALLIMGGRLVWLQIIKGDDFVSMAKKQYESVEPLIATRGIIFDCNGHILATNNDVYTIAIDPKSVQNQTDLSKSLSKYLKIKYSDALSLVTSKDTRYVPIKGRFKYSVVSNLEGIDKGIIIRKQIKRNYEYGTIASQILGGTNIDLKGISGLEQYYDKVLKGENGYMIMQRDRLSQRTPSVDLPKVPAVNGEGIGLTIDINIQQIVEEELLKGVKNAGAASGTAIAVDPRTGEVLALVSLPTYNPNDLSSMNNNNSRMRALVDNYEPGSTMKVVTASAALQEKVINVNEKINTSTNNLLPYPISDDHKVGTIDINEAMEQSSNVFFADVALKIPNPKFRKYIRDFGFGINTGIDLPGEISGFVCKGKDFTRQMQAYNAHGYGLSVTPLQMVMAYSAIANGGKIMKPFIVKKIFNNNGSIKEEIKPKEIREVVVPEVAANVRDMLVRVVEGSKGTGRRASVPGLRIAGKTGTAKLVLDGKYSENYNASFVGFFPAYKPSISLLILLNSPKNAFYGGEVAAPIFGEIAKRISSAKMNDTDPNFIKSVKIMTEKITPDSLLKTEVIVPDLRGMNQNSAISVADISNLRILSNNEGSIIGWQSPAPGTKVKIQSAIKIKLISQNLCYKMPDLKGLSIRQALNILSVFKLRSNIKGRGVVMNQTPKPGTLLDGKIKILIECG